MEVIRKHAVKDMGVTAVALESSESFNQLVIGTKEGTVALYRITAEIKHVWRATLAPSVIPVHYLFRGTDILVFGEEEGTMYVTGLEFIVPFKNVDPASLKSIRLRAEDGHQRENAIAKLNVNSAVYVHF